MNKKFKFQFLIYILLVMCLSIFNVGCSNPAGGAENKNVLKVTASTDKMESIDLSWTYKGSDKPAYYTIKYGYLDTDKIYDKTNYTLKLLRSGWSYEITVFAYNSKDEKICSTTTTVKTGPIYVPDLDFEVGENKDRIEVLWRENGCDFKKQILYCTLDKTLPLDQWEKVSTKTRINEYSQEKTTKYTYDSNKTHYFKLVCYYPSDTEVFGEKDFEFTPGILAPNYLEKKYIDVKTGVTSVKVTIDTSEYGSVVDKFIVEGLDGSSYNNKIIAKTAEVTPTGNLTTCTLTNIKPSTFAYVRVTVVNEAGTSSTTCDFVRTGGYFDDDNITVIPGQTDATIYVDFDCDYIEDDLDITYSLTEYENGKRDFLEGYEPQKDKVIKYTNLQPATLYIPDYTININYIDVDGNEQKWSSNDMASFRTNGYDAPSNFICTEAKSQELTFTFDELTDEQTFGYKVSYELEIYDGSTLVQKLTGDKVKPEGTTITKLNKGKEYKAVLTAKNSGYNSDDAHFYSAIITANTESGLTKPVIKAHSETPGTLPFTSKINLSWDKLSEDTGNNITYGIEYKIFKGSDFKHYLTYQYASKDESNTYFDKYILVNSGNRYIIRLYAFKDSDPDDIAYSDELEFQLQKIDDSKLYGGLIYTYENNIGAKPGDLVDLSNNNVWEGGAEIRSTEKTGYMWGVISFLEGDMDPLKYGLPTGITTFNSVKMSYEKALDSSNPRVLFYDRSGVIGSEMAQFDAIYIVQPDEDGSILEKIEKKTVAGETISISDQVNMPFFGAGDYTRTMPSEAGLPVDESWMFNNSLYIGVKQSTQGFLGFSYYY